MSMRPADPRQDAEVIAQVQAEVESLMGDIGIHTVYTGFKEVGGVTTDEVAIVALVEEKISARTLKANGVEPLPPAFEVNGVRVSVDVQQAPRPTEAKLRFPVAHAEPLAGVDHRECFDGPIPCGTQIAPQGAGFVGTMGGPFSWIDRNGDRVYGALTNWHVAHGGTFPRGHRICQPHGSGPTFGVLEDYAPIDFRGGDNLIDAALIRATTDQNVDLVGRNLFDLGECGREPVLEPQLGDRVVKSGRTTGVMRGRVVGINATSHVAYEQGTGKFVRQVVIQSDGGGDFSAGGDSGSLICLEEGLRPHSLLFAGGGGKTISNPIKFVLDHWPESTFA